MLAASAPAFDYGWEPLCGGTAILTSLASDVRSTAAERLDELLRSAICASFRLDEEVGRHLALLGGLGWLFGAAPDQLRVRR